MAIYHLSTKPVSRAGGRSATAAAAYRAGEVVHDLSTDQVFDYSRRRGVEHTEIVLPRAAAQGDSNWARDRQALWNAAERAEKRKDARVAREYEVALPHELKHAQRVELVRAFSAELANRYGVAVDFAIHKPHRLGDERNHHAHILATTRQLTATGLGAKAAIEWSDTERAKQGLMSSKVELKEVLRKRWEELTNHHLALEGSTARIDRRTLAEQGIERLPTTHLGPAVSGMERRGIETEVGKRIAWQRAAAAQARLEQAAALGKLEREGVQVQRAILDLSGDLKGAQRERERAQAPSAAAKPARKTTLSIEGIQAEGREQWLQARERARLDPDFSDRPRGATQPVSEAGQVAPRDAATVERERLARLSVSELKALIGRIEPAPVEQLVEADPVVMALRAQVQSQQRAAQQALLAKSAAAAAGDEFRRTHGMQAKLHDIGVVKAAYLVEREAVGMHAEQRRLEALAASGLGLAELKRVRDEAAERITQATAPARAQAAELKELMMAAAERERPVVEFEQLARGRAAGFYPNSSQAWQATPAGLRKMIDLFNQQGPQQQAEILKEITRQPSRVQTLSEHLELRRQEIRERSRDRGWDLEL